MIYRLYDLDEGHEATLQYIELPVGHDGKDQDDRLRETLKDLDIGFERIEVQSFTRADDVPFWFEARDLEEPGIKDLVPDEAKPLVETIVGGTIMKLRYIGRQSSCRYYWRIFRNGSRILYCKVDGGVIQPVAY